jgi:hypothetical protein
MPSAGPASSDSSLKNVSGRAGAAPLTLADRLSPARGARDDASVRPDGGALAHPDLVPTPRPLPDAHPHAPVYGGPSPRGRPDSPGDSF